VILFAVRFLLAQEAPATASTSAAASVVSPAFAGSTDRYKL